MKIYQTIYVLLFLAALSFSFSSCSDDEEEYRFINQGGIFLKEDTVYVTSAGGKYDLSGYSDGEVVYSLPEGQDWLDLVQPTRGMSVRNFSIEVSANDHIVPRYARVSLSSVDGQLAAQLVVAQEAAACSHVYKVEKAGTLSTLVGDEDRLMLRDMKVTGPLNGEDLAFLRQMCASEDYYFNADHFDGKLEELDLSEASIISGGIYMNVEGEDLIAEADVIGEHLFRYSLLKHLALPQGIKEILSCAFQDSRLEEIVLPASVRKVYYNAFNNCVLLKSVTLNDGLESLESSVFEDCLVLKAIEIPASVKYVGDECFNDCFALESVILHEGLEYMDDDVFEDCHSLKSIVIPNSVKFMGNEFFDDCYSLQSVVLHNGLKKLDDETFEDCRMLREVTLPDGLETIGSSVFDECYLLQSLKIPASVKYIGPGAFDGCESLRELELPAAMTEIEEAVFAESYLEKIVVPAGVTKIYDYAFLSFRLRELYLYCTQVPEVLGSQLFFDDKVFKIYVPASMLSAYKSADFWKDYADRIFPMPAK